MYRSIAVATTFSPRFLALLSEAARISRYFQASLRLIHAGEKTEEKCSRFTEGLSAAGLPANTPIDWVPGDPSVTIPQATLKNRVDLLIAGALENDTGYRPFANSIARLLISEAPSDVFLLLRPQTEPNPVKNPAVLIDFSPTSRRLLQHTVQLASRNGCEKVHAVHLQTIFDQHRLRAQGETRDPGARLDEFVMESVDLEMPIDTQCIQGNTGFTACEYVQNVGADLLCVPTGRPGGPDDVLGHGLDWLLQVIPCNLWIMRPSSETKS